MKDDTLKQLSQLIEDFFGDTLEFALVYGSRARNEHQENSDIDLMLVFTEVCEKSKIEDFKRRFVYFQQNQDFIADTKWPGEFLTLSDLQRAIDGYGFVKDGDYVDIDLIEPTAWSNFNEYRLWLCAMAGPNIFVNGNKESFGKYQSEAFYKIILSALLARRADVFFESELLEELVTKGKKYLGFCDTQYSRRFLLTNIPEVCDKLKKSCLIDRCGAGYCIDRIHALNKLPELMNKKDYLLKKKFVGLASTEEDLSSLHKAVYMGLDFILDNDAKVLNYKDETEIRSDFEDGIPKEGQSLENIVIDFNKKILDGSIRQANPNYLAFPDAGNSIAALTADILVGFTNQNLIATDKSAPTATFAEIQVVHWFRQLVGFPNTKNFPKSALEVGGSITTGGTLANATALLVARCKAFPNSREKGLCSLDVTPILIIAADTFYHYSHIASFWWLGLGEENIVYVNTLDDYRLDCDDLDKKLYKYNSKTSRVVAVVSQAGDSRTTTIEDFNKIADITQKHRVWLHVDACHGGVLLFSEKHRARLSGIERANSISIDPHKGLCTPYPASMVIFRDVEDCGLISKSTDISIQKGSYDLGQMTPFLGSRGFDSLKLWFFIKHLGTDGISELIEYRYDLAKKWHAQIEQSRFFVTLNDVELNSVVFTISPKKLNKLIQDNELDRKGVGKLNKLLHDRVYQEGKLCIHSFDIVDVANRIGTGVGKLRVLGVTLGNPYTDAQSFPDHIKYLDELICQIVAQDDN